MAYTLDFSISLGSSKAGLTLAGQIVDTAGVNVGSEIAAGFIEIGNGTYLLHCTTIPDDHRGGIKIYQSGVPGTILAFRSINPEENEIVSDVFSHAVEGAVTFLQWVRRSSSILFGKSNGGGSAGSKKFRNLGDTVNRVDATTDANGNRTSVTFDDT